MDTSSDHSERSRSPDVTEISAQTSSRVHASSSTSELGRSMEGRDLGPYRLLEFVGGGGMGAVFRALDSTLDRIVAVKVLSRHQSTDDEMLKRFRNEAQSAARLDHENIGRVYAVGSDDGWHYIVFEYIEGTNLRDIIARFGPFDLERSINVLIQIADALEHASQRDVVHRDIKPSNIIITPSGRARIVDMGLARLHHVAGDDDLTSSGMTLGTFDYISPEQARDPRVADIRSDLYSLGCTAFFMLTGRPPFASGTMVQKLLQHQQVEPPPVESLRPGVPQRFGEIIRRLMRKDPDDRYQRPAELESDLLVCADDMGVELTGPRPVVSQSGGLRHVRMMGHLPWLVPVAGLALFVAALKVWPLSEVKDLSSPLSTRVSSAPLPMHTTQVWRIVETPSQENERSTLGEVIPLAESGDEIELAYTGVRDESPFRLSGKTLSIRAASGFMPTIRLATGSNILSELSETEKKEVSVHAGCLLESATLQLEGVDVLAMALPQNNDALSLFALQGSSVLECVDVRLQILQGLDFSSDDELTYDNLTQDACVSIFSPQPNEVDEAACMIDMTRTTIDGAVDFLRVNVPSVINVRWDDSSLNGAIHFMKTLGAKPSFPLGPQISLELIKSRFRCVEGFASLTDSAERPVLPSLSVSAASCEFSIEKGWPLLDQVGIGDPDAYRLAIEWIDSGGVYRGSPIFRRIDGGAERVEINFADSALGLAYIAEDAE